MTFVYEKLMGGRSGLTGFIILAVFLVVVLPLTLDSFRLNLVGKYLTYAFAAVSLVLLWGYGGILSLDRAFSFGLGALEWGLF